MTVMDNDDWGMGLKMECQQVNLHDIDAKFMASFIKSVDKHSLKSWCMENAMDIGIKARGGGSKELQTPRDKTWIWHIPCLENLAPGHFNKADQIIKEGGVWLMPSAEAQHKYINTTLSMVRSVSNSNLGKILQDGDMFNALFELFKYNHFCSCENVKPGLSMHGMARWYPGHAGCMLHVFRQFILMLDFLAAPVEFQDSSKDVPPSSDVLTAFEAKYWHLSSRFDKPISVEAHQVLDDKLFIDRTDQHLLHMQWNILH
ncbi:hypothetical protein F5141DRAFT_1065688 [Pisolithus sp. B1]|nr:hypothetical protein F5141DRAFT_1065688 [Pisolithus sp. B1]